MHGARFGGGMQVKTRYPHIGQGAQPVDGGFQHPIFITVAESSPLFFRKRLLRAESGKVTVDAQTDSEMPVGIKGA